jgi:hypothetical protein
MDEILNPTIYIGNFEWREPITTLTDFLVAIVALIGFFKFNSYKGAKSLSFNYFKFYFLCFAIGMTSAAWMGHGLQAYVSPEFKIIGWVCAATGLLIFGLGSFIEIKDQIKKPFYLILKYLFITQYITFVFLMLNPLSSDFILAQLSSTISLIAFIFPVHLYNYLKTKVKGSIFIVLTITYSIVPGLIYSNQLSINKWFNYHDISHVLMAFFMLLMIVSTSKLSMLKNVKSRIIQKKHI